VEGEYLRIANTILLFFYYFFSRGLYSLFLVYAGLMVDRDRWLGLGGWRGLLVGKVDGEA
jgi:hypothetical protein